MQLNAFFSDCGIRKDRDFTSLIVVHTNQREPGTYSSVYWKSFNCCFFFSFNIVLVYLTDALLIIGLPDGPTAHFKLSKLVLRKDIKVLHFCVWANVA
jgi:ribosome production factor 1